MSPAWLKDDRLVDLLVKQTTEGVSEEERTEIERLFANYPGADRDLIARTAAALTLAANVPQEPLPTELRDKVRGNAAEWLAGREARVITDIAAHRWPSAKPRAASGSRWPWLAAAACLVLALAAWWPRVREDVPQAEVRVPPSEAPAEPTPAQLREQLLARGTAVRSSWTATEDPAGRGVAGDVVWDNETQQGYLRFTGLAANDPQRSQYQLWIFDARQDERYPIDGGVFDIPSGASEVVVPIDAKILVREPVMFAVTIEKPGGVVVSGREHIVALAKVAAG